MVPAPSHVTFRTGYDLNIAAVDVQNRVAAAQGRLPQEIKNTGITITKANPNFVFAAVSIRRTGRFRTSTSPTISTFT